MIQKIKFAVILWSVVFCLLISGCGAPGRTTTQIVPIETARTKNEDSEIIPEEESAPTEVGEDTETHEELLKDLILKHNFTTFKFVGENIENFCKTANFKLLFVKICAEVDLSEVLLSMEMKSSVPFTSADGIIHTETSEDLNGFYCQAGKLFAEIFINFDYLGESVKINESKLFAKIKRVDETNFVANFSHKLTEEVSFEIICNLSGDGK